MRTTVRFMDGLVGQDQYLQAHADVKVGTVITIHTLGTTYGSITVMVSQVHVVQGSTTTETGVSFIYRHCLLFFKCVLQKHATFEVEKPTNNCVFGCGNHNYGGSQQPLKTWKQTEWTEIYQSQED